MEINSSMYLITRFNKAESCFSTQMSRFDDVSFPACDEVLLNKRQEETAAWKQTEHKTTFQQ